MSEGLPGPHHCIATARAVTEIVFRSLQAQCAASGGILSLDDLESFHSKIIDSFSSGFDLFELRHHQCMDASLSMAEMPFARDKILATLLRACGEKSARHAFSLQVEYLGPAWLRQFFDGFAQYVRKHVCVNADMRLINAYVDVAAKPNIELSIEELLKQDAIQSVLRDCVHPFEALGAPEAMTKEVCDSINDYSAGKNGITGPHVIKITENQISKFLRLMPPQLRLALKPAPALQEAEPSSLSQREKVPEQSEIG